LQKGSGVYATLSTVFSVRGENPWAAFESYNEELNRYPVPKSDRIR